MKLKALCVVFLSLFFVGCADRAPSTPNFSVSVSQPIFITNFKNLDANASNKTAYVFFKNSSGYQNNLESAVRNKLSILGFSQSPDTSIELGENLGYLWIWATVGVAEVIGVEA